MKKSKKAKNPSSAKDKSAQIAAPTREEIAACAYSIWQQEGRPEGRQVEHWLAAEIQLRPARCRSEPPK